MRLTHAIGSACAVAMTCGAAALFAQTRPAGRAHGALIDATRPLMQVEEVALKGTTPVFGDPAKAGPYILRTRLAANQAARPHYEDQDRFITVLKGTLWIGKGDLFSPDKLLPVREGGIAYLPANTHYFHVAGDGDVILQITGNGPVKSVHTEVDAKGQPVAEGGPYPMIGPPKRRNPVDPDLLTPDQIEQMERDAAAAAAAKAAAAKTAGAPKK
jgi:hypothetical protein